MNKRLRETDCKSKSEIRIVLSFCCYDESTDTSGFIYYKQFQTDVFLVFFFSSFFPALLFGRFVPARNEKKKNAVWQS